MWTSTPRSAAIRAATRAGQLPQASRSRLCKGKALLDGIVPFDHLALLAPELLAEQLHGQNLLRRPGMEVAHAADEG